MVDVQFCCGKCKGRGFLTAAELPRVRRRVFGAVRSARAGITLYALIETVYGDDPDGGPISAEDSIRVTIHELNKQLAPSGMSIKATSFGRSSRYMFSTSPTSRIERLLTARRAQKGEHSAQA